jgi:hypothetical protein
MFSATVEEIDYHSTKIFKFQRFEGIREFSEKAIFPPPFVIFEYILLFFQFAKNYLTGSTSQKVDNFRKNIFHNNYYIKNKNIKKNKIIGIQNMEECAKKVYIKFETKFRDLYIADLNAKTNRIERKDPLEIINKSFEKLENNLNMFKLWVRNIN